MKHTNHKAKPDSVLWSFYVSDIYTFIWFVCVNVLCVCNVIPTCMHNTHVVAIFSSVTQRSNVIPIVLFIPSANGIAKSKGRHSAYPTKYINSFCAMICSGYVFVLIGFVWYVCLYLPGFVHFLCAGGEILCKTKRNITNNIKNDEMQSWNHGNVDIHFVISGLAAYRRKRLICRIALHDMFHQD